MRTPWVRGAAVVLTLLTAGFHGLNIYEGELQREAERGRVHAMAAYRIDPDAADRLVERATHSCLREMLVDLLPDAENVQGLVPVGLTAAFVAQLRFGARWREGMDAVRFSAAWIADQDAAQERYNAQWVTMDRHELAAARALRRAIAGGEDPRGCIYRRVARGAPAIYAAPGGAIALRGPLVAGRM